MSTVPSLIPSPRGDTRTNPPLAIDLLLLRIFQHVFIPTIMYMEMNRMRDITVTNTSLSLCVHTDCKSDRWLSTRTEFRHGSQSKSCQEQPRQAECNYMSSTRDAEHVQKNNINKSLLRSMTRNMFKLHYQQFVIITLHEPAGQSPAGQVSGVHRLCLKLTDIECTSLPVSHPLAS